MPPGFNNKSNLNLVTLSKDCLRHEPVSTNPSAKNIRECVRQESLKQEVEGAGGKHSKQGDESSH